MSRAVEAWNRFWFAPQATSTLAIVRIAFGVVMVAWAVAFAPDLLTFFSTGGLVPRQPGPGWGLLRYFPSDSAVIAVYAALLASSVCVLVGFFTRLASAVLFVCLLSFVRRDPFILNSGDLVLQHIAFFLALSPAGAALSIDRWRRARDHFWEFPPRALWALRLAQIQLSVIYLASVWAKVRGVTWNDGTAVSYALRLEHLARFPLPDFVMTTPLIVNLLTYGTLAIELGVAILVWNRKARPWALAAGAILHLGIDYRLEVGFFSLAMLVLYLAFIPPETMSRWFLWLQDRLGRSRLSWLRRLAAN